MMKPSVVRTPHRHAVMHGLRNMIFLHALLVYVSGATGAGQIESFSIVEVDGVYQTRIIAILDAPAEQVFSVITDYRHIYRINPSIVETEILSGPDEATIRVRNRLEHCFAIFCFTLDLVEDVVAIGEKQLVATTVADLSSFRSGTASWHVRPFAGNMARIQYRADMKPDFFVPPLIGSAVLKSALRKELTDSLARIECQASIIARRLQPDTPVAVAGRGGAERECPG